MTEISPALVDALIDAMGPSFPEHVPGTRPIHSKGIGVGGSFVATEVASQYCAAKHFGGQAVPVTVRFSNGNGQLDPDFRLQVRGMAVKFFAGGTRESEPGRAHTDQHTVVGMGRVEDGPVVARPGEEIAETDLICMSAPVFMAQSAERLLEFEQSYRAVKVRRPGLLKRIKSLLTMSPLLPLESGVTMSGNEGFLQWARTYPPAQAFLLANAGQRLPASYARAVYDAVHAFEVHGATGTCRMVRFSLEPSDGVFTAGEPDPVQQPIASFLRPEDLNAHGSELGADYLQRELRQRLSYAPGRFNLRMQIADPWDDTSDPTVAWPTSRRRVLMGTLTLTHVLADQLEGCELLSFNPGRLLEGMAISNDPVLGARSAVYEASYQRRIAARGTHATTPSAAASPGCPMGLS